jgi:hypothetical protein
MLPGGVDIQPGTLAPQGLHVIQVGRGVHAGQLLAGRDAPGSEFQTRDGPRFQQIPDRRQSPGVFRITPLRREPCQHLPDPPLEATGEERILDLGSVSEQALVEQHPDATAAHVRAP